MNSEFDYELCKLHTDPRKGAWLHDVCSSGSEESMLQAAGKPCEQHASFNMAFEYPPMVAMVVIDVLCRL